MRQRVHSIVLRLLGLLLLAAAGAVGGALAGAGAERSGAGGGIPAGFERGGGDVAGADQELVLMLVLVQRVWYAMRVWREKDVRTAQTFALEVHDPSV